MFYTRVGQYVDVRVEREGQSRLFSVKVSARPENEPMQVVEPSPPAPAIQPLKEKEPGPDDQPMPFETDLKKDVVQPVQEPEESAEGPASGG